ncbi:hypothetical protein EON65_50175, partial [archaeon]
MVGKHTRKRQGVELITKDNGPVDINRSYLVQGVPTDGSEEILFVLNWLDTLAAAESKALQQRLIQQNRKIITSFLSNSNDQYTSFVFIATILLRMFLSPALYPLHLALDFICITLKSTVVENKTTLAFIVRKVWLELQEAATVALNNSIDGESALLPVLQSWCPSMSAIGSLERDLKVLCDAPLLSDSTCISVLNFLVRALEHLHNLERAASVSIPDIPVWGEVMSEGLRSISYIIRANASAIALDQQASSAVLSQIAQQAYLVLLSPLAPKDAVTGGGGVFLLSLSCLLGGSQAVKDMVLEVLVGKREEERQQTDRPSSLNSLLSTFPSPPPPSSRSPRQRAPRP